jgi:hypothetical protein
MLRRKIFAGRTTLGLLLSACWSEVSQVLRNWASGGFAQDFASCIRLLNA